MALFHEFTAADLDTPYIREYKLFEEAKARQRYLDGITFGTVEEAETETTKHVDVLDEQAISLGLLHQSVQIYSAKLVLSRFERDLHTGIRTNRPEKVVPPHSFDDPNVIGSFFGFTEVIPAAPDEKGRPTNIRPQLCFTVQHAVTACLPNISGRLACFAPITDTRLEFISDKQREDTTHALSKLALGDDQRMEHAAKRILYLTQDTAALCEKAPKVGMFVRKLLNRHAEAISDTNKFALLDLIQARFGTYEQRMYHIEAKAAYQRDGSGIYRGKVIQPQPSRSYVDGIAFGPSFTLRPVQGPTESMLHSPTITFSQPPSEGNFGTIVQVPLERLTRLEPLV